MCWEQFGEKSARQMGQFYIKPSLMLEPTTFVAEVADEGRATGGGGEGEEVLLLCPALAWSPRAVYGNRCRNLQRSTDRTQECK